MVSTQTFSYLSFFFCCLLNIEQQVINSKHHCFVISREEPYLQSVSEILETSRKFALFAFSLNDRLNIAVYLVPFEFLCIHTYRFVWRWPFGQKHSCSGFAQRMVNESKCVTLASQQKNKPQPTRITQLLRVGQLAMDLFVVNKHS